MIIYLSPQRSDDSLEVSKLMDTLTINGDHIDLSGIPDGATLPSDAISNKFIVGEVNRVDGDLHVTLLLPHGPNPPYEVSFPQPLSNPSDGILDIPQHPGT